MRCSKCGYQNPEGMKFCGQCTDPLALTCPKCDAENPAGFRFCGQCTAPLSAPDTKAPSPSRIRHGEGAVDPTTLEGERKTVTALFADLKGSMDLMEDLDPEDARAIVDPALRLMIDAVHRYDGYVVQSTGDGIFALFGAPVAHEDHPQRALYAALRMQEEIKRLAEKLRAEKGVNLQVRVGVNTGEVVVRTIKTGEGNTEYTPIGHSTSLASRLQTLAAPGSTAISEAVRKLVDGYFALKSLGPARIKGASEPVNIYEVNGLGPLRTRLQRAVGRGLTKFVGREAELAQMRRAMDLVREGRGQIVAAMGEAGVGKSRLFEFKAVVQSDCMVLEAYSASDGRASAYLPVIELLREYFAIDQADDERRRREKIAGKIVMLDRGLEDSLPYLFTLINLQEGEDPLAQMDPQIKRRRTLEGLRRIFLRESLNQPLILVFEDLHWIDRETRGLLDLLVESIASARVLLLVNYRPQFRDEWGNRDGYTQLRLEPLGAQIVDVMLMELLGDAVEVRALKRTIVERTEGNPFFIEELLQGLFDEGVLVRNGTIKVARSLSQVRIPPSAQAVLAARIDRLPADEKALLQMLAVVGREFPLDLVRRMVGSSEAELDRMLSDLQNSEFIYEQPAARGITYTFKHALTQEVAYNSLLIEQRKALHERAGQTLETMFARQLDDHLDELARHYSRSDNVVKAVEYLCLAGHQAIQRSAFSLAASYFEDALVRLKNLPDDAERSRKEIAIHTGLADVAIVTSGYAAADYESHLTSRHELAERLGDATQVFYSLVGISVLSAFRLELSKAREIGMKVLALADRALDPAMQLEAHGSLANILWLLGDFVGSREHSEKGINLFARNQRLPSGKEHMRAACLFYASLCAAALGFPDEGLRRSLDFLSWSREKTNPLPLVFALNCAATVFLWRREGNKALEHTDALLALTAAHGFRNWHSFAQIARGQALVLLGKTDEAVAELKSGLAAFEATGAAVPGWAYAALGFGCLAAQQPAEGLRVADNALQISDQTGDAEAKPELHRLRGELLLGCDRTDTAEAESSFRTAIDAAREQRTAFRTTGNDEPRAAVCATRSSQRRARNARRDIQLVHRGLRHCRPEGCQGAARRAEKVTYPFKTTRAGLHHAIQGGLQFLNEPRIAPAQISDRPLRHACRP